MRMVIDLQGAQSESRYRGIGRYSLSLALIAVGNRRGHEVHVALNGAFAETVPSLRRTLESLLPKSNIHVWHVPLPVHGMFGADEATRARIERAEWIREAAIASLAPDLVHISSLFEGYGDNSVTSICRFLKLPTVVTLYDMIPLLNPATYLDPAPSYKAFYNRKLDDLKRADGFLAISDSAAAEVSSILDGSKAPVFNISAACDSIFRPLSSDDLRGVKEKFGLDRSFILYSGGSDERKNLRRLVEAYSGLELRQREACRLVFAGRIHASHVRELRDHGASQGLGDDELVFTGYVTDDDLVALYNLCRFFIFPSWHEGFGLPVLEAMSCGAAVLASDASSIREVAQFRGALFDPFDVRSIRERMAHYLDSETDLATLKEYSFKRSKEFSWNRVAERFWDACEQVHRQAPPVETLDVAQLIDLIERRVCEQGGQTDVELMALADSIDRSLPPSSPMIMVDVSELAARDLRTGIQRVTRAIVMEWSRRPPPGYRIQLVRVDRQSGTYICANAYAASVFGEGGDVEDTPLICHAGDIFLGLDLVGDCVTSSPKWFQYLRDVGVRTAFIVYDILPVRYPHWWPGQGGRHHERWLRGISEVSDSLICISKATANDVAVWMDEHRIETRPELTWFHLGADIQGSLPSRGAPEGGAELLTRLSDKVSFLMVGTLEPRKGHGQVLRAFEQLWARGNDVVLVIVGKRGWLVDELCDWLAVHPERGMRLFWLEGASDEFLEQLYSVCSCLIAASQAEGFGLPLIEAAQRQLPVLARDIPVFREIAGSDAFYFDGDSPEVLREALLEWIEHYREARHPRTEGIRWLTWEQSADELAAALLPAADPAFGRPGQKQPMVGSL